MSRRLPLISLFCSALCVFGNLVHADEEFLIIDSDLADYDGSKITLTGSVIIEHEIGNISAGNLVLTPDNDKKKNPFSSINMRDNVKISFHNGGQLSCSVAQINAQSMEGNFSGNFQQEYVIYSESRTDKFGHSVPILMKSREMQVKIQRDQGAKGHKPMAASISEMIANDNVTVNYNHDLLAIADQAIYRRNSGDDPGCILMQARERFGICQATNRNGDTIHSTRMQIDPITRQLTFDSPKGVIYTREEGEERNRVDFSCNTMTWNEQNDLLTLRGNVLINQEGFGQIVNNEEMKIHRFEANGQKHLRSIEGSGETTLSYSDLKNSISHTLACYGKVFLDHEHLQTSLESPRHANGEVLKGKQIYFQDRLGEIYADKAVISYDYINHKIAPAKITLIGHVQILNRTAADAEDKGKFLQYAVADQVDYFPLKNKMYFKSEGSHRVLFFDKTNNIKVSAPALKILRNPNSKKDSIQGIGDVRFSFIEEELEELRKRFNLPEEGS